MPRNTKHETVGATKTQLAERGVAIVRDAGIPLLVDLLEALGRVLHVEEVVVSTESPSLVKSQRGLSFHTDHHRADIIVWYCIAQTDRGGESILVDALDAYASLSQPHRAALERVMLQEHNVFEGDTERHPLVTLRDGRPRFYYSYWLADDDLDADLREAFEAFAAAVGRSPQQRFRLEPGDILAIDNGRILHGRTEIEGTKHRHLRRYWIETSAT